MSPFYSSDLFVLFSLPDGTVFEITQKLKSTLLESGERLMNHPKPPIESFSHMWSHKKDDYVLLKVTGDDREDVDGCLPYNIRSHSKLIIEDDEVYRDVALRMKAAGVLIVFKDELPAGENEAEALIKEMHRQKKSPLEIQAAIKAYKEAHPDE